jgi:demethylmenaquinone methyltransferase/2-methoxy-6-polyprenyl-1,4-benzoquinol methylase
VAHLDSAFASPDAKRRHVRALFATIADRYDLVTRVLSYGMDVRWKRLLADRAAVHGGERALDVACGTGDIAVALAARGAAVCGLDLTHRMIQLARAKSSPPGCVWTTGDMMALPFSDGAFDLVTTGYGLRNVPDLDHAIAEVARVMRPGARFLSLDFNRPDSALVRTAYLAYLDLAGGALGWALHDDPGTDRYIPASIRRYPGAAGVASRLERAGLHAVTITPLLGGLMTLHFARK